MIGYTCKYAPVELMEAMGAKMVRISPSVSDFREADSRLHTNMCSYVKGVLEEVINNEYEGVLLTSCCDSTRRLYDVLKASFPGKFIYLLDLPRSNSREGAELFASSLETLIRDYEAFSHQEFSPDALNDHLTCHNENKDPILRDGVINIGLAGARMDDGIIRLLESKNINIAFDLSCTGIGREITPGPDGRLSGYARALLAQFPCMRIADDETRRYRLMALSEKVDGIIYHTVKFCDNYSYEYALLSERLKCPSIQIDTDLTKGVSGQILTRLEAFLESVGWKEDKNCAASSKKTVYVMGVDSGSTSTNAVIMDETGKILAYDVVRTGAKTIESASSVLDNVLEKADLDKDELTYTVATGYGRVSIPFADETVTEISCHGKGAYYFNRDVRTILDIGGQDSKAIRLNEKGDVADFVMNDKCAAGTGRFLEMIARTLELDVEALGGEALRSKEEIEITSMCTVFAESEVISLIADNRERPDIANAVCRSIANKAYTLLTRVGLEKEFMMTGGVAKNKGVVRALEQKLGAKVSIPEEPEIVGAVGAALYALEKCHKE